MRRAPSLLVSAAVALAALSTSGSARADVSSWLSVQLGVAQLEWRDRSRHSRMLMPFDVGVGTPPSLPVMVGVGARLVPYFSEGFDYAAYVRLASQGYVTGRWGAAIDGGAYTRAFGGGSSGWLGTLNLGGPWGIIASGTYETGNTSAKTMSVTLGIDLLRLTVYRLSGEQQWPNVNPAWR
jgi:hypothetical protein